MAHDCFQTPYQDDWRISERFVAPGGFFFPIALCLVSLDFRFGLAILQTLLSPRARGRCEQRLESASQWFYLIVSGGFWTDELPWGSLMIVDKALWYPFFSNFPAQEDFLTESVNLPIVPFPTNVPDQLTDSVGDVLRE
jgi:hypothetical protein